jgi:hypothetical protein
LKADQHRIVWCWNGIKYQQHHAGIKVGGRMAKEKDAIQIEPEAEALDRIRDAVRFLRKRMNMDMSSVKQHVHDIIQDEYERE